MQAQAQAPPRIFLNPNTLRNSLSPQPPVIITSFYPLYILSSHNIILCLLHTSIIIYLVYVYSVFIMF